MAGTVGGTSGTCLPLNGRTRCIVQHCAFKWYRYTACGRQWHRPSVVNYQHKGLPCTYSLSMQHISPVPQKFKHVPPYSTTCIGWGPVQAPPILHPRCCSRCRHATCTAIRVKMAGHDKSSGVGWVGYMGLSWGSGGWLMGSVAQRPHRAEEKGEKQETIKEK